MLKNITKIAILLVALFSFSLSFAARKNAGIGAPPSTKTCETVQATPRFDGGLCESLAYLKNNLSALTSPHEILQNQSVLFLGDTHPNVLLKRWLARNLSQFKALGFTHVALEFLNSESQDQVDAYLKNPQMRSQIVKLVQADWGWIPEEHVSLIDAIHKAGLKVVAIDNRNELDRQGYGNDIQRRNIHMSGLIEDVLHESGAGRVVVLTGKLHSALISDEAGVFTLPQMLHQKGIANLSYDLESGEEPVPRNMTQAFFQELKEGHWSASSQGDYFLPAPTQNAEVDGVIYISR